MPRSTALYIDHDCRRRRQIRPGLESLGFEPHTASTISAAKSMVKKYHYRLVLMRFATLGKEAADFCSFADGASADTLIIVLMAKARIDAEEQLFSCGADDVVVAPQTSVQVLTKRIRAHLQYGRRFWSRANTVKLKDTVVDMARREARCNGSIRRLPGVLADLLKYFLENPERIISRKELLESPLWADSICTPPQEGGKTIDVSIGRLRRIIESDPRHPQIITSVRGIGWKLAKDHVRWW